MDDRLAILEEIELLLRQMLPLAERSAEDDCEDEERIDLQERLEALLELVDYAADRYEMIQEDSGRDE